MKIFLLCLCFVVAAHCYTKEEDKAWVDFKKQHKKVFSAKFTESKRKDAFLAHKKQVEEHNERYKQGLETYEAKLYSTSDLTDDEFARLFTGVL